LQSAENAPREPGATPPTAPYSVQAVGPVLLRLACSRSSRKTGAGRPLVSCLTIVQLISATTTDTGLKVQCEIDPNSYPAGVKVTDAEMYAINIHRHEFHGDWNYTISPQPHIRSDSS
jgi:hypothetical protein